MDGWDSQPYRKLQKEGHHHGANLQQFESSSGWHVRQLEEPPQKYSRHSIDPNYSEHTLMKEQFEGEKRDAAVYSEDDQDLESDEGWESDQSAQTARVEKWRKRYVPDVRENWRQVSPHDRLTRIFCPVCKQIQKGVHGLLQHASTVRTKRSQHEGFHKALTDFFYETGADRKPQLLDPQSIPKTEPKMDEIVWPPTLVILNTLIETSPENGPRKGLGSPELLQIFKDSGALKGKPKYGPGSHHLGVNFLEFESSQAGYLAAVKLDREFQAARKGLSEWETAVKAGDAAGKRSSYFGVLNADGKRELYGYLAGKGHMERLDPGRRFVKWRMAQYDQVVVEASRKLKEEAEKLRMEQHELAQETQKKDEIIEEYRKREKVAEQKMAVARQWFQNELQMVQSRHAESALRDKTALELTKKKLLDRQQKLEQQSRLVANLEAENVRLRAAKVRVKQQCEVIAKHEQRVAEMEAEQKEREARFKQEQDKALLKLKEGFLKERADLVGKLEQERDSMEQQAGECGICFNEFSDKRRRAIISCGHVTFCMECMTDWWTSKKKAKKIPACPKCCQPIKAKPQMAPTKFYLE